MVMVVDAVGWREELVLLRRLEQLAGEGVSTVYFLRIVVDPIRIWNCNQKFKSNPPAPSMKIQKGKEKNSPSS